MFDFWQNFLYPILKSPATTTIIAIIAAIAAFIIYRLRRRDYKRDAANIILLEIKNAERNRREAKKLYEEGQVSLPPSVQFPEKLRLMSTESWTKYKYLFVRDFEPEQWDEIGLFYENCRNFDEAVEHKDSAFRLNEAEIRANIQKNIADYAKELADKTIPNPNNDEDITRQNTIIMENIKVKCEAALRHNITTLVHIYNPDKSFNDASYYFNLIPDNITNNQIGSRLKQLAGVTNNGFVRRLLRR